LIGGLEQFIQPSYGFEQAGGSHQVEEGLANVLGHSAKHRFRTILMHDSRARPNNTARKLNGLNTMNRIRLRVDLQRPLVY
jgi:hypothetical protein